MEQMLLPILMFAGLGAIMYFGMKQAEASGRGHRGNARFA